MESNSFECEKGSLAWYKIGTGKPVLILHGWGSDSKVMMPMAKQIQNLRTSYLVDFPGFGGSPEPKLTWTVDDYADIVEEFASKKIEEPQFDLIVHSFGARVALKLLTRPEISPRIDKVVFTGAAGLKPKRSASFYLKKYTAKTLKLPFYLLPQNLREKGLDKLRKTSLWKSLGSSDYQKLSGVMRQTFVACVNEYLDHLLPNVQQEILLIWGENDTATPMDQGKRMEKLFKDSALVVINGASHYAFLDKPKQFSAILQAYLEPANN
ncbi:alpha/beta fold hydrolase [Rhodohalobacter sp. 614A]|uniref:alpha/beta fold hydrolase n=1 Tax=Rhodohalobacter sp. 614A TaxID=2908649 RepID=UPI001F39AC64|nr:alpha/beta hydrolase [Rhodohalobacter sp. 614A]